MLLYESTPREIRRSRIIAKSIVVVFAISYLALFEWVASLTPPVFLFWKILLFLFIIISTVLLVLFYWIGADGGMRFTNYERVFHPFYKYPDFDFIFFGIVWLIAWWGLTHLFGDDTEQGGATIYIFMMIHIGLIYIVKSRLKVLNPLPVDLMKEFPVRLIYPYHDYLERAISDDEPHLVVGQELRVVTKEFPRDENEASNFTIYNDNTPSKAAVVTTIKDRGLREALKDGYRLEAILVAMHEEGNVEVELTLKKSNGQA